MKATAKLALFFFVLVLFPAFGPRQAAVVEAQCSSYTQVTGTLTDPSSVPYAGASLSVDLSTSASATCTGPGGLQVPFSGHFQTQLDSTGSFAIQLPPNSIVTPSGTQWTFSISITVPPPVGRGNQKFSYTGTISGSSQSLSSALSALAPAILYSSGGGTGNVQPGAQYALPLYSLSGTQPTVGPSNITTDSTHNNLTVPGILYTPQVGSLASPTFVYSNGFDFNGPGLWLPITTPGSCGTVGGATAVIGGFLTNGPNGLAQDYNPYSSQCENLATAPNTSVTPGHIVVEGPYYPQHVDGGLAVTGAGAAVPTGPSTTTTNDCVKYTNTTGQQGDSGAACGGSGNVSDGSGTTTANKLLASTTTAHTYSLVPTLPTAAMPALSGDVTNSAGSLSTTVGKVNGASVPASQSCVGTNSSSQFVAGSCSGSTPTIVVKRGSATGTDYTSTATSGAAVDGTNLTYTATVPTGSKWTITVTGSGYQELASDFAYIYLGSGSCSTAIGNTAVIRGISNGLFTEPFSAQAVVTGDGASHTVLLCYYVSAGTVGITDDATPPDSPQITYRLEVSN